MPREERLPIGQIGVGGFDARRQWVRKSQRFDLPLILAIILTSIFLPKVTLSEQVSVRYRLEKPGRVSAAVYNSDGRLLRTLLRGKRRDPGPQTLHWDGLDREGNPQPAGSYTVKILRTPGFKAEFLFQLGVRPNSAPYHMWVGNHSGPTTFATDPTGVYIGSHVSESPPGVIKQSLDGTKRFWSQRVKPSQNGPIALAADGRNRLYWLRYNGIVKIVDADSGAGGQEFFGGGASTLELRVDSPGGPKIATVKSPGSHIRKVTVPARKISGVKDLYAVNATGGRIRLRRIRFDR